MTFNLLGLGLWDEKSLTLEEMELLKESDKVYIEKYTSKWYGKIEKLEKITGKKINPLERKDFEENSHVLLNEAKNNNVSILVPGDPMIATTHSSLILEAKKLGIKTKIIHNASIFSAIGETGLQIYKFGPSVTIPFKEKSGLELPISVYDKILENKKRGLHTLCLLDLVSKNERYMSPNEAMKILLELEKNQNKKIISDDTEVIIFGRAGSKEPLLVFGKIKDLVNNDFGNPPFVLIIPGKLHFTEKEYLEIHKV